MAEPPRGELAIVGASARAAAFASVRAGLHVVVADLFADADLAQHVSATRIAHYPDDLATWLRDQGVAAWMYSGALENHPRLVDRMARCAPLLGNTGRTLRDVRSPQRLANCLRGAGLSYPDVAHSGQGLPTDGSWLCKPLRGSNGVGIEPWTGQPQKPTRRKYWQRRVDGTPCAALYVAAAGAGRLLGVTQQLVGAHWTGAKPFQYAGSVGPWPTTTAQRVQINRIAQTLAGTCGLQGLFGVDLVLENDTVWTIEVNPRYTAAAEVVERFTGINPVAAQLAACQSNELPTVPITTANDRCYGKAILYAQADAMVARKFVAWALERSGTALSAVLADIPPAGTQILRGNPGLTVFAIGETPSEVEAKLQLRIDEVGRMLRDGQS